MPRPDAKADSPLRVGNASRGGLVCSNLLVLEGRWARFKQSWGHRWREDQALLLTPADAVHSFGAPKDGLRIHYLDESWQVIGSEVMARRRSRPCPAGTHAALILPGLAPNQEVGDRLEVLGPQPRLAVSPDGEYPSDA